MCIHIHIQVVLYVSNKMTRPRQDTLGNSAAASLSSQVATCIHVYARLCTYIHIYKCHTCKCIHHTYILLLLPLRRLHRSPRMRMNIHVFTRIFTYTHAYKLNARISRIHTNTHTRVHIHIFVYSCFFSFLSLHGYPHLAPFVTHAYVYMETHIHIDVNTYLF